MGSLVLIAASTAVGAVVGAGMSYPARRLARTERGRRFVRPALLAVVTALLFAALAWRGEPALLVLAADAALAAGCVPLAAIDLGEQRLPTQLTLPLYPILLVPITAHSLAQGEAAPLLRALAGMATLVVFYLAVAVISGQLGAGDVRLAGVLGLVLAWHGWTTLVLGTLVGLLIAATAGLVAMLAFGRARDHRIALGPALIAGAVVAILTVPTGLG